jgi:formylglycine-generating enzyme required for sulfatase activity
LVPGATFYRSYDGVNYKDKSYPAKVSDFYLDKYEITVGRLRPFVNAGKGTRANPPTPGDGVHPKIPGSGWDSAWNFELAGDTAALKTNLSRSSTYQTWTDTEGPNESKPINYLDWYTAFAFCAWDGGRLPTEAEWNFAASGGSEQRYYPWSNPSTSTLIDDSYAFYNCNGTGSCTLPLAVGTKSPKGDGKWGHSDLAGNLNEWTLDWYATALVNPCVDCANLVYPPSSELAMRAYRGGGFGNLGASLCVVNRMCDSPGGHGSDIGARCARDRL